MLSNFKYVARQMDGLNEKKASKKSDAFIIGKSEKRWRIVFPTEEN